MPSLGGMTFNFAKRAAVAGGSQLPLFNSMGKRAFSPGRGFIGRKFTYAGQQGSLFGNKYKVSGPVRSSISNNALQDAKKNLNKWMPTILGAGIIGGGVVAYSDSRKNGRRNNELFRP